MKKSENVAVLLISLIVMVAISVFICWLVWLLYIWVMPQLFPSSSTNLIKPNFWVFYVVMILLKIIGSTIFGSKKESK